MTNHTKLTASERDQIALLRARGMKGRGIARELRRSASAISVEIKGNLIDGEYVACYAQSRSEERRERSHHRYRLKNEGVHAYVHKYLREGWSPEQISGRMKLEHPEDNDMRISPETIYQYIYDKENKDLGLWEFLPRKQERRKKWKGRQPHRGHIAERVSIHERPEVVNNRLEKGHWEGDTVEGKGHLDGIHTEVERLSRYLMANKVSSISSAVTLAVQKQQFNWVPETMRRSTTLDNGKENHLHYQLSELTMQTYFCDPYSSWQKGSNENHNGLLRRYLPKGTDFKTLTEEDLQDMVYEINNRPRKVLGFRTAQEVFTALTNSDKPFIPFQSINCSDPV